MEWSSDLVGRVGGGTRFDSRLAQVTLGGHVGRAFPWIFTQLGHVGGDFLEGLGSLFGRVVVTFS